MDEIEYKALKQDGKTCASSLKEEPDYINPLPTYTIPSSINTEPPGEYINPSLGKMKKKKKHERKEQYTKLQLNKIEDTNYTLPRIKSGSSEEEETESSITVSEAPKKKWLKFRMLTFVVIAVSLTFCTVLLVSLLTVIAVNTILYAEDLEDSLFENTTMDIAQMKVYMQEMIKSIQELESRISEEINCTATCSRCYNCRFYSS